MINREIESKTVNLLTEDGQGIKQMSLDDAIELAEEQGLDLICLNNKNEIPVVKIGDYKKLLYEKSKKEKDNKKKARLNSQVTKEIQLSDCIAEHDLKIKAKNASRLLQEGNKVKLVIKYRGRSVRLIGEGPSKLHRLSEMITYNFKVDIEPKIDGNQVTMLLSPIKK